MNEFNLLRKYMIFYIQMLEYKYSDDISHSNKHIPDFEEWKNGFGKNFTFRNSIRIGETNNVFRNHATGIGIEKGGIAYRDYDYCLGRKYFKDIDGNFTILANFSDYDKNRLNKQFKKLCNKQ